MLTNSPYVATLLVETVAAVVICDLRDAGIITAEQARFAWLLFGRSKRGLGGTYRPTPEREKPVTL